MPDGLRIAIHEAREAIRRLPHTDAPLQQLLERGIDRGKYDDTLPIREKLNEVLLFLEPFDQENGVERLVELPRLLTDSLIRDIESLKTIADEIPRKCQTQTTSVVPPSFHGSEAGVARAVEGIYARIYSQLASFRPPQDALSPNAQAEIPAIVQDVSAKVNGVSSGTSPLEALGYLFSPARLIEAARKAHPAFRYAIVAAALCGLVVVVTEYGVSPATLVFGAIILVVLMVLFLVFSQATVVAHTVLSVPAMVLVWSFLVLSILTAVFLFTSAFFDAPLPIRSSLIHQLGTTNSNGSEPALQQHTPPPSPTSRPTPNPAGMPRGELGMTLEELQNKYQSLKDRFAEQEALVVESDLKRVLWLVTVVHVESCGTAVCMTFSSKTGQQLLPSWSARFPMELKQRIYSLRPGDVIQIEGILKANGGSNYLELEAQAFQLVSPSK